MNTKSARQATIGLTVLLCFFAALFEGFDIQSAGVAAPRLALAFHLDDRTLKWVFTANIFGLLVGAIIGGRLADVIGRKRVLVLSMIAFGLCQLGTAMVHAVDPLILMRLLTGLGLGGAMPNMLALAAENSPADRRGLATAIMYCGMPLGGAIASFTAMFQSVSWQQIFYIGGFAPLLAAPVLALILPESRGFQALQTTGVKHIPIQPGHRRTSMWFALFGEGRASNTLLLWAAYGLTLLVMYMLLNWLPTLLQRLGLSRSQASAAQIFFNVGGATGSVLIGFLLDRARRQLTVLMTYLCMCGALLALALLQPQLLVTSIVVFCCGSTLIGAQAIIYVSAPVCYATAFRGTGVGSAVAIGRVGSVAGPLLAGVLLSAGLGVSAMLLSVVPFIVIGGLAAHLITRRTENQVLI
ncbi:MAG: 3-(3-hydroxy-phenyl)propionate transporter MhpT [Steroidobacteraceae bacterium]|jgi:AAHS family 3-hydroxyphenylpropionic acid transporter